jgi:hypothetical protein
MFVAYRVFGEGARFCFVLQITLGSCFDRSIDQLWMQSSPDMIEEDFLRPKRCRVLVMREGQYSI